MRWRAWNFTSTSAAPTLIWPTWSFPRSSGAPASIRLRADPSGRRVQAHQQPLASREDGGHQEPAGIRTTGAEALRPAPRHLAIHVESIFPGQHAVNHARRDRGAAEGVLARYVDEMFRHMWVEPKDMDDPEVVRAALEASGFDAAALLARTQEPEVKDRCCAIPRSRSRAAHSGVRPSSSATKSSSARTGCATSRRRSSG